MIKALNLPSIEVTPDAIAFMKATSTDTVILWAPNWAKLEPTQGQIVESIWAPLDQAFRACEGLMRIVCVPSSTPTWACTQWQAKIGRSSTRLPPDNTSPWGAWAHFLGTVFRRYPEAHSFIVMNEPNLAYIDCPERARETARLIKTAVKVARRASVQRILAPGTADGFMSSSFTENVLRHLNGHFPRRRHWKPKGVTVRWAHHPYTDVKEGVFTRTQAALDLLNVYWHGGRHVSLTEGGYRFSTAQQPPDGRADPATWHYTNLALEKQLQIGHVKFHVDVSRRSGCVGLWANYEYVDSLWGGWASGFIAHDGTPHPLRDVWGQL